MPDKRIRDFFPLVSHSNCPVPGALRLWAVDWLCSRALIRNKGDPTTAPHAPHAAPAARLRKKNDAPPFFFRSAPNAAETGPKRDSLVPFISVCTTPPPPAPSIRHPPDNETRVYNTTSARTNWSERRVRLVFWRHPGDKNSLLSDQCCSNTLS